jgi:hypothetical protein
MLKAQIETAALRGLRKGNRNRRSTQIFSFAAPISNIREFFLSHV